MTPWLERSATGRVAFVGAILTAVILIPFDLASGFSWWMLLAIQGTLFLSIFLEYRDRKRRYGRVMPIGRTVGPLQIAFVICVYVAFFIRFIWTR